VGVTTDDTGEVGPASPKTITTVLREARSLSRRATKLTGTAQAVDDPTTQQLVAQACTTLDQLVHHLMTLERHAHQHQKAAARRR
jgi:DNA-binding ferritin-like protein